jgi:hypothetical protein
MLNVAAKTVVASRPVEQIQAQAEKFFSGSDIWPVVPAIGWVFLAFLVLLHVRSDIKSLIRALVMRVKDGASIKIGDFEIGSAAAPFAKPGGFSNDDKKIGAYKDDGAIGIQRSRVYADCRGVMISHQIQKSAERGQLYDILIYVIPHKGTITNVSSVEYFFGSYWGDKIFPSTDKGRGFPITTSAYGPFLCAARINFTDGQSRMAYRYIDFEMGHCAPPSPSLK